MTASPALTDKVMEDGGSWPRNLLGCDGREGDHHHEQVGNEVAHTYGGHDSAPVGGIANEGIEMIPLIPQDDR